MLIGLRFFINRVVNLVCVPCPCRPGRLLAVLNRNPGRPRHHFLNGTGELEATSLGGSSPSPWVRLRAFSYRAPLPTTKDEWTEMSVPLADFIPTSFGL